MAKKILKILLVFVLGAAGGIWSQLYFFPYLAQLSYFEDFQFAKNFKEQETNIYPRTEITIKEGKALSRVFESVEKSVVGVKTETDSEILTGSGLALTNDGLMVTLADLVPQGSDFSFYVDEKWPSYQILKRDFENNLALVKLGTEGLRTVGFAEKEDIKPGEEIFLVAVDFEQASATGTQVYISLSKAVNEGIIKRIGAGGLIETNMFEDERFSGSPLFNIEGKAIGICTVVESGQVFVVPISAVQEFSGL